MPRLKRDHRIETREARRRLNQQHDPYWRTIHPSLAIGYRKSSLGGVWKARKRDGIKYLYTTLGTADDYQDANGVDVLSYKQAHQKAFVFSDEQLQPQASTYTLRDCIADYVSNLEKVKPKLRPSKDAKQRLDKHVPDRLLNKQVINLKSTDLTGWLHSMVPKMMDGSDAEQERARKAKDSANRVWSILKAALNLAYNTEIVPSDNVWRRVTSFEDVGEARKLFLQDIQVRTLLDQTKDGLHNLIKAGVLTGARAGELTASRVRDFDARQGTLRLASCKGKGKIKIRECHLSTEAKRFFKGMARDKLPEAHLLTRDDGMAWLKDSYQRPFRQAVIDAKLPEETTFYSLRHYHISKALIAGVAVQVIAENCGTSVLMIEKHYGKFMRTDRQQMFDRVKLG